MAQRDMRIRISSTVLATVISCGWRNFRKWRPVGHSRSASKFTLFLVSSLAENATLGGSNGLVCLQSEKRHAPRRTVVTIMTRTRTG